MEFRRTHGALRLGSAVMFLTSVICAQQISHSEGDGTHAKTQSEGSGAPQIVPHRINPHEGESPTAGSTGVITPDIAYHGGPVMATPNVYLIWYGNWNQANGSDTPAGQQIVRDFLHGLSGSNFCCTGADSSATPNEKPQNSTGDFVHSRESFNAEAISM